jgi:predicted nuclease of predicted toxin-antitoxin system
MAKLYSNENFPLPVVEELRRLGHDVLTIQETGKAGQAIKDEVVLEYAVADDRALLTLNRKHFTRLHGERPEHDGIIVRTVDADFAGQAARIHAALEAAGDLRGQLIRVNRPSC